MGSPQLVYQKTGALILKIEVLDSGRRKLYKAQVNILDKKRLARVFETLKSKFDMEIPEKLKEELDGWDALNLG